MVIEPKNISANRRLAYAVAAGLITYYVADTRMALALLAGCGLLCFSLIEGWFADLNQRLKNEHVN